MNSTIQWLVQCYGHCIPRNAHLSGTQFASIIRKVYDCNPANNPRNWFAANHAEKLTGEFYSVNATMGYKSQ